MENSDKEIVPFVKGKLNEQLINISWKTPGQFTHTPNVENIFQLCYSVKCWLDLHSNHVAIIHCANGRTRTGIVIACLLKYIGAFSSSADSFQYFCGTRYASAMFTGS